MSRWLLLTLAWPCLAQISDLATTGDGRTLLFRSQFRLQTETELGTQGKIYRWQDGVWSRVAAAPNPLLFSPPDVAGPMISADGSVFGWHVYFGGICLPGCPARPTEGAEVIGVTLPPDFPRARLRMSANGRFFIGGSYFDGVVKYFDRETGRTFDVPGPLYNVPLIREIADDGTALFPLSDGVPRGLVLWRPGSNPRELDRHTLVAGAALSSDGRIAFETVGEGKHDGERALFVLDSKTMERIQVAPMPTRNLRDFFPSYARPSWNATGTALLYRAFDDQQRATSLALWDTNMRTSRTLITADEGFLEAVISGDGATVWAITNAYRLLRVDASSGQADEVLPPLGAVKSVEGAAVPGSAVLLRGAGFLHSTQILADDESVPVIDAGSDGLWFQTPWEWPSDGPSRRQFIIRTEGNPFEGLASVWSGYRVAPFFALEPDPHSPWGSVIKAVHEDFRRLVSADNPARPGETVHLYLTGLGPLDQPVPTGALGPSNPPARPLTSFACYALTSASTELRVPFLAYAPGLVGVYQADVTLPNGLPAGYTLIQCTTDTPYVAAGYLNTATTP